MHLTYPPYLQLPTRPLISGKGNDGRYQAKFLQQTHTWKNKIIFGLLGNGLGETFDKYCDVQRVVSSSCAANETGKIHLPELALAKLSMTDRKLNLSFPVSNFLCTLNEITLPSQHHVRCFYMFFFLGSNKHAWM